MYQVVYCVAKTSNSYIKAIFNANDQTKQKTLITKISEFDMHYRLYIYGYKKLVKMKDKVYWELC